MPENDPQMMTIQQTFDLAIQHHQAGRLQDAEQLYRQILARQPDHFQALLHLGILAHQQGREDLAIELIRKSITLNPRLPEAHNNLGIALQAKGQIDEAVAAYRRAIALKPSHATAHFNLGVALQAKGQLDQAIAAYRQAITLRPDFAEAFSNLGVALTGKKEHDQAITACRQAIALKPGYVAGHFNLGNALQSSGQLDQAIGAYRQAIALKQDYAEAHFNLGNALKSKGQLDPAIAAYRQAIALAPDYAEAHCNLGVALQDKGQLDEAIAAYRQAILLKPNLPAAHNNLGNCLKDQGLFTAAIAAYRTALRYNPDYSLAYSNILYGMHFDPGYDAKVIFEEHIKWDRQFAQPLKKFIQPHANDRNPERRLRIGYVSADLCWHVVGMNMLSLLQDRDRKRFEVFCYSGVIKPDQITDHIRSLVDGWRNINGKSDQESSKIIRDDGIDILVDLTLHMAGSRLLVFARKPAPVQVTYLGYCSTTGLEAMDYRLSDPYLDPPDADLNLYTEETLRLPDSYWCYQPGGPAPEPSPPPVLQAEHITFGCLNNFCKVSPTALGVWTQILQRSPQSRLIVHSKPGLHLDRVLQGFVAAGIAADRIEFVGLQPWLQFMNTYNRIDIGLDPFPYNGGITTCDSLYMGVPVVSLSGQTAVGRASKSILSNVGLPELIAETRERYVQIAIELAGDLPRLTELRGTLRARMQASPLMDAKRFTRNVESAYRQMWRGYAEKVVSRK
jgi:protein O-GlcNAc transferase